MYNEIDFSHHTSKFLSILPTIFVFLGIILCSYIYFSKNKFLDYIFYNFKGLYKFISNKWYIDEFYNKFFVKNFLNLGKNFYYIIDINLIDRLGPNGIARLVKKVSIFFSSLHSGYIYHYAFSLIIGIAILITLLIFFY